MQVDYKAIDEQKAKEKHSAELAEAEAKAKKAAVTRGIPDTVVDAASGARRQRRKRDRGKLPLLPAVRPVPCEERLPIPKVGTGTPVKPNFVLKISRPKASVEAAHGMRIWSASE